jgi:hypothetical protein
MPLPEFNNLDDLLEGVHRATLDETPALFGRGSRLLLADQSYFGAMAMIQNDVELECAQERIAYFSRLVANMRKVESPENFRKIASGYLAEIEKMTAEVIKYLKCHPSEMPTAEAS